MKKVGWVLAIIVLVVTSVGGLYNAPNELPDAETGLQLAVGFGQLAYGIFGLFATVGMIRRRPWTHTLVWAWAVASAFTGSVASFAFHDPNFEQSGTAGGVLGAFFGTLVLGALIAWSARVNTRPPKVDAAVHPPA